MHSAMLNSEATWSRFNNNGIATSSRGAHMVNIAGEQRQVQTTQSEVSADLIDLALGHPSPGLLPLSLLRGAVRRLRREDRLLLQYGYEQGDLRFRSLLAGFLSGGYGLEVSPEELFVSAGVSQALDLICSLFTRPGDRVLVEEPSYFLALRIFADHGLRVEGLATDRQGLLPDALQERLRKTRPAPALLYTVPTYHNPAGTTLPQDRRERIVELCREHGVLLVADEVYHLLSFAGAPPSPLAALARGGGVLSLGSFSKILAPGLRLGWIQGSPELLRTLATCGFLDSGGGLAPFTSAVVRSALERGDQKTHVSKLRGTYGSRARAMGASLKRALGERAGGAAMIEPAGGFFYWVRLEGMDTEELLVRARERGVTFAPGRRFSTRGGMQDCLRLSFSYYDEQRIGEGISRLAEAIGLFR
jgi:DNA-binding transcriptional MocR family regulator